MKTIWLAGVGCAVLAIAGCSPSKQTVATVNGKEITREQLVDRLIQSPVAKQTLQTLILENIIINAADKKGIKITDEDVNRYLTYRRDRMPPGRFDELQTSNGRTEAIYKEDARAELALRALALQNVKVSDESIDKFYKENAGNAFVKPAWREVGLLVTKDKADADKAIASMKKGADFAAVSQQFSIPAARQETAELQWFGVLDDAVINEQGQPVDSEPIANAIRKTPAGQMSAPVVMPGPEGKGEAPERLLVYVKTANEGGKIPLEEVRNDIIWQVANQNNEIQPTFLQDIVKEAKIDVKIESFQDLEKPETLLPQIPMGGGPAPQAPMP